MPRLEAPESRHRGIAVRKVRAPGGREITIGLLYDPSRVPPAKIDAEFTPELELVLAGAHLRPEWQFDPWEAVARLEARYPGDVLPHPTLALPERLRYPRWYPSDEERAQMAVRAERRAKGAYVATTGDWAVDGEGGG